MFPELLEGGAHGRGVRVDLIGIHRKHHTVNLVLQVWFPYETQSFTSDRLLCTELWDKFQNTRLSLQFQTVLKLKVVILSSITDVPDAPPVRVL